MSNFAKLMLQAAAGAGDDAGYINEQFVVLNRLNYNGSYYPYEWRYYNFDGSTYRSATTAYSNSNGQPNNRVLAFLHGPANGYEGYYWGQYYWNGTQLTRYALAAQNWFSTSVSNDGLSMYHLYTTSSSQQTVRKYTRSDLTSSWSAGTAKTISGYYCPSAQYITNGPTSVHVPGTDIVIFSNDNTQLVAYDYATNTVVDTIETLGPYTFPYTIGGFAPHGHMIDDDTFVFYVTWDGDNDNGRQYLRQYKYTISTQDIHSGTTRVNKPTSQGKLAYNSTTMRLFPAQKVLVFTTSDTSDGARAYDVSDGNWTQLGSSFACNNGIPVGVSEDQQTIYLVHSGDLKKYDVATQTLSTVSTLNLNVEGASPLYIP